MWVTDYVGAAGTEDNKTREFVEWFGKSVGLEAF